MSLRLENDMMAMNVALMEVVSIIYAYPRKHV